MSTNSANNNNIYCAHVVKGLFELPCSAFLMRTFANESLESQKVNLLPEMSLP